MPASNSTKAPQWLRGEGRRPKWHWSFRPDAPLARIAFARESGAFVCLDEAGHLYRIDRDGALGSVNRLRDELLEIAWSDTGNLGAAIVGDRGLMTLTGELKVRWTANLPEDILAIAVDPHGHYICATLADGGTIVFSSLKKKVASFETIRPLAHVKFIASEPVIMAAAEHGLLCCHTLGGEKLWDEQVLSNCGSLSVSGDGSRLMMASFTHGIQVFDDVGETVGAYMIDGTAAMAATSFSGDKVAACTLERQCFWIDEDGEPLWLTELPEDAVDLAIDPLGDWMAVGLPELGICKFGWE